MGSYYNLIICFAEPSPLHTTIIMEKCTLKFVDEMQSYGAIVHLLRIYHVCKNSFCELLKLGGATSEIMSDLLAFEADRRAVNITINSIELTRDDRRKLYSNIWSV
ncbi:hypothetical protein Golax_017219 [Gossypium laxum]|uniref:Uncharacterized protein n=1 Tax=Gossypium laxum TaxID=34288 RepID=A0A7J8Z125_9ROSI|nr:hypothetical protein [Gossypium laxum]